jgi:2-dehydro-3-deoxygluconokinase
MDVVTIGESMVLFTPQSTLKYSQNFSRSIGGAETNVAIGLSRLGHKAGWISKVGNDEFGKAITSFIRGEGVNVDHLMIDDEANTGIYFKEILGGNNVNVQYYRRNSAASKLEPGDLNEDYIAKAKYLHVTGITPALSESCYETILKAITIAKDNNVKVVFDPNLRRKLWDETKAKEVLTEIALQSDIFLPGMDEAVFLINKDNPKEILEHFRNKDIPLTILKHGEHGSYYLTEDNVVHVLGEKVTEVVDPVGAGDAFTAGLISGLLDNMSIHDAIKRGNVLGAFVVQTLGDIEGLPERDSLLSYEHNLSDVNR